MGSRNLSFVLSFDSQLIIPIDFVPSDVIAGWITLPPLVETNRAEFGVATFTAPPISENGVLGTVNFSLSDRFKGQAAIRLEGFSIGPSSTELELFLPRTTIILSDAPSAAPQDFNADGQVDFGDFFLFAEQFGTSSR